MAIERELKFSTADDHVPSTLELELALAGSGLSVQPGTVKRHVDVYHDVDGRLSAAGMALRLRRSSTGVKVTLKSDARVTTSGSGVMHERTELEVAAAATAAAGAEASGTEAAGAKPSGDGPDSRSPWPQSVRASFPPGVAVEHLTPVAELRIRRVAFLVVKEADPHSGRERFAELAFDEVTCVAPGSRNDPTAAAVFHEVEIEWLGEGDELDQAVLGALERLADAVGTVVNLTASAVSKLDRALALLAALEPD